MSRTAKRGHLLLHGVGEPQRELEPGEGPLWIRPTQLAAFLDEALRTGAEVSIDDSNRSDIDLVLPALLERGMTATFFVLPGRLDQRGSLSRAAVVELRDAGMAIGSHGMHHRSWRRLAPDDEAVELVAARQQLEDLLGQRVDAAACPFGAYGRRTLTLLRKHGYEKVLTSDGWPSAGGSWLQPRFSVAIQHDAATVRRVLAGDESWRDKALHAAKARWKRSRP